MIYYCYHSHFVFTDLILMHLQIDSLSVKFIRLNLNPSNLASVRRVNLNEDFGEVTPFC